MVTAALSHPDIVTIHSVEKVGDVGFVTMELVEGLTAAERVPDNGVGRATARRPEARPAARPPAHPRAA